MAETPTRRCGRPRPPLRRRHRRARGDQGPPPTGCPGCISVRLRDVAARDIIVTAEALLSSRPTPWAGPWPVDTGWWGREAQKVARLQMVGQAGDEDFPRAWLLMRTARRWRIEATYG